MNLIETNHQINMTSALSNNSFKSQLNTKSFNIFLTLQQLCEARFPYFALPYSTTRHHKYWINQNICQVKPTKFIIKLYTGLNTLWVKNSTHHKAESLRASSLSKLDNTFNDSSNTKYSEFSIKQQVVLYFHNPIVHRTVSTISTNKCSSTLVNFHLLIPPLSVHKIILTLPTNTPFLYT